MAQSTGRMVETWAQYTAEAGDDHTCSWCEEEIPVGGLFWQDEDDGEVLCHECGTEE